MPQLTTKGAATAETARFRGALASRALAPNAVRETGYIWPVVSCSRCAWWLPTTQQTPGSLGSLAVLGVVLQVEVAPQNVELHPIQQVQEGHHPGSCQGPREGQGLDALPGIQLGLPAEAASPAGKGSHEYRTQ